MILIFTLIIRLCFCSITTIFTWNSADSVSENTTYRITNLSQEYYYINVTLQQKDFNFFLLASVGKAPEIVDGAFQSGIYIDENGQQENRQTRFIKVERQVSPIYITVIGRVQQQYQITVRGSSKQICPNECSNNGYCGSLGCECRSFFSGNDCHHEVEQILYNENTSLSLQESPETLFYYPIYSSEDLLNLSFEVKIFYYFSQTNSQPGITICYKITEISSFFNTTNSTSFLSVAIVKSDSPLSVSIKASNAQQSIILFMAKKILQSDDSYLRIHITRPDAENLNMSTTTIIILIVISIASFIFLVFIYIACKKCRTRLCISQIQSQSQQVDHERQQRIPIDIKEIDLAAEFLISVSENEINQEENCAICLEKLISQASIKSTPCHHYFHALCIKSWLEKTPQCPNCRACFHFPILKHSLHRV